MKAEVFPKSLLERFVATLHEHTAIMARWRGDDDVAPLRQVASELQALLDNPVHVWVSTAEAARIHRKSEETIRRWCREGRAPFRFCKREDGQYEIWLPDLLGGNGKGDD